MWLGFKLLIVCIFIVKPAFAFRSFTVILSCDLENHNFFQKVDFLLDSNLKKTEAKPSLDYIFDQTLDQKQCWEKFKTLVESEFSRLCYSTPQECEEWESPVDQILQIENKVEICHGSEDFPKPISNYLVDEFNDLRKWIFPEKNLPEPECADLQLNQTRTVRLNSQNSATGIEANYNITKIGDKKFDVVLNTVFSVAISDKFANQNDFYNYAQECLRSFDNQLVTSNGEEINLRLPDKREYQYLKNSSPVRVLSTESRSNVSEYSREIDCSVILHESLHHLGLVDEYTEPNRGYVSTDGVHWTGHDDISKVGDVKYRVNSYNCRISNSHLSLMSFQLSTLEASLSRDAKIRAKHCFFHYSNSGMKDNAKRDCEKYFNSVKDIEWADFPSCRQYNSDLFSGIQVSESFSEGSSVDKYPFTLSTKKGTIECKQVSDDKSFVYSFWHLIKYNDKKPKIENRLIPNYLRNAILYPNCRARNSDYYACSKLAYQTSFEGPKGCDQELTKQCNDAVSTGKVFSPLLRHGP